MKKFFFPFGKRPAAGLTILAVFAAALWVSQCAKPTDPGLFIQVHLANGADSIEFIGNPIMVVAVFDSAIPYGAIQWQSVKGIQVPTSHLPSDTTSSDTAYFYWKEFPLLPRVSSSALRDSAEIVKARRPTDSVWVSYNGNISNSVRVFVLNRAPVIDSVFINSRKVSSVQDSLNVSGNHAAIAYITLYASDADTGSYLTAKWVQGNSLGEVLSLVPNPAVTSGSRWSWNIRWQAPSVDVAGDSTVSTSAFLEVMDRRGGISRMGVRIIVYRESGSIWVASTNENQSTLIKYSSSGQELFRIPGFRHINSLTVNANREEVWFTDDSAGTVTCIDDDGNLRYEIEGFSKPLAIDVHNREGYGLVADMIDSSSTLTSRLRVINRSGHGGIDSAVASRTVLGLITSVRIDQSRLTDFWITNLLPSNLDSVGRITHYSTWWTNLPTLASARAPASADINEINRTVWVADPGRNQILRISTSLTRDSLEARINGFRNPSMVAVNERDSSCWVVDTDNNRVVRLKGNVPNGYNCGPNGGTAFHTEILPADNVSFFQPRALAVNPNEDGGVVWVADTQNNRIVKLDKDGEVLLSISGFGMESSVFIAANTGTR